MSRRNAIPRNSRQAQARERALAVLARMRRFGSSLSSASKVEGTDPSTVRRYAASALRQERVGGRFRVKTSDRIPRTLNFPTPQGQEVVVVRSSRTASLIAEYLNSVRTYLNRGDVTALARFEGKSFRAAGITHTFITDPSVLDHLGDRGLPFEGLYRVFQGVAG